MLKPTALAALLALASLALAQPTTAPADRIVVLSADARELRAQPLRVASVVGLAGGTGGPATQPFVAFRPNLALGGEGGLYDVDFPGGTLEEFVKLFNEKATAAGNAPIVIQQIGDAEPSKVQIGAVRLRSLPRDMLVDMLPSMAVGGPGGPSAATYTFEAADPVRVLLSDGRVDQINSITLRGGMGGPGGDVGTSVEVYRIGGVLASMDAIVKLNRETQIEGVRQLIDQVLAVAGATEPKPEVSAHAPTATLIVKATGAQHALIEKALNAADPNAPRVNVPMPMGVGGGLGMGPAGSGGEGVSGGGMSGPTGSSGGGGSGFSGGFTGEGAGAGTSGPGGVPAR